MASGSRRSSAFEPSSIPEVEDESDKTPEPEESEGQEEEEEEEPEEEPAAPIRSTRQSQQLVEEAMPLPLKVIRGARLSGVAVRAEEDADQCILPCQATLILQLAEVVSRLVREPARPKPLWAELEWRPRAMTSQRVMAQERDLVPSVAKPILAINDEPPSAPMLSELRLDLPPVIARTVREPAPKPHFAETEIMDLQHIHSELMKVTRQAPAIAAPAPQIRSAILETALQPLPSFLYPPDAPRSLDARARDFGAPPRKF